MQIVAGLFLNRYPMPFELKKLGVEFLEQPLPAGDWEGHSELLKNQFTSNSRRGLHNRN
jgi:hypothetical protein